jgi:hypothetical protein
MLDKDGDSRFKYVVSMYMMNVTGALERTEGVFAEILRKSGFRIVGVYGNKGLKRSSHR